MKSVLKTTTNRREFRKAFLKENYPPYWDEGIYFYPRYRPGYKNNRKVLYAYQIRMYKTWKHNRKKQWKN